MPRTAIDNPSWSLEKSFTPPTPVSQPIDSGPWIPIAGKLGLTKAHKPKRKLSAYIDRNLAAPPLACARPHPGLIWQMFLNDQLGDCVPAMILHGIMDINADVLNPVPVFSDQDAESWYGTIGGYVPGDPSTDQGCDENVAMAKWRAGLTDHTGAVHQITDTLAVNPQDQLEVHMAIYEFSVLFAGAGLPLNWQGQSAWRVIGNPHTDPDAQPGSWGGHAFTIREYDQHNYKVVTWGTQLLLTKRAQETYVEECHVVVTEEMLGRNSGKSVTGLAWGDLASDLHKDLQAETEEPKPKAKPASSGTRTRSKAKASDKESDDNKEQEKPPVEETGDDKGSDNEKEHADA